MKKGDMITVWDHTYKHRCEREFIEIEDGRYICKGSNGTGRVSWLNMKDIQKGNTIFCWDDVKSLGNTFTFEQMLGDKYLVKPNNMPDTYLTYKNAEAVISWVEHDGAFPDVNPCDRIEVIFENRSITASAEDFVWGKGSTIKKWRRV